MFIRSVRPSNGLPCVTADSSNRVDAIGGDVVRKIGCLLAFVALAAGCGGPDTEPTQETLSDTPSISATPRPDVVGEWLRARTCEELIQALTQAGFKDFAPSAVESSGALGNEPVKDPEQPCADAKGADKALDRLRRGRHFQLL
jgi:hypothetical protein